MKFTSSSPTKSSPKTRSITIPPHTIPKHLIPPFLYVLTSYSTLHAGTHPCSQVVIQGKTPEQAYQPFANVEFRPFRDAGYGQCNYKCTVFHSITRYWTAFEDSIMPSDWAGLTTKSSTLQNTSTMRRLKTETLIGLYQVSL